MTSSAGDQHDGDEEVGASTNTSNAGNGDSNENELSSSNGDDISSSSSVSLSLYEKAARTKRVADLMRDVEELHRKLFLELADVVHNP